MMRVAFKAICAALLTMAVPSASFGAIEGFSNLNVVDFGLFHPTAAGSGVPGTALDVSDFTSLNFTFRSSTLANLNAAGDFHFNNSGPDSQLSLVGDGTGIVENDFSDRPDGTVFARSDTGGTGAIITGIPGFPFPADVQTVAEIQLGGAALGTAGGANGQVTSNAGFSFTIGSSTEIVADFDASSFLTAELDQPPGQAATASHNFAISITTAGGTEVFRWTPDGVLGTGIFGGTELADAFDMTNTISQNFNGSNTDNHGLGDFRASVTLAGGSYNFSIEHGSTVSAVTLVPEPASVAVWGLIGVLSTAYAASKCRKAA